MREACEAHLVGFRVDFGGHLCAERGELLGEGIQRIRGRFLPVLEDFLNIDRRHLGRMCYSSYADEQFCFGIYP